MSTLEPGRQASAQILKAIKHRSQTDRRAPRETFLHMSFLTHTCPLHGEDGIWALPFLPSNRGS